jgi:UDP-N-acetylmuramoyl-L-alanyl-D-glutamate--2,6-diaminopimelate ligase
MRLSRLLEALPRHRLIGSADMEIKSIELDSRRVGGEGLFVCLEGLARNGHDFAAAAVNQGAVALVVRHPVDGVGNAAQVVVDDPREAMARLAAAFHGHPARSLRLVGVTGTNGKTTVTHLVEGVAEAEGEKAEVLGTLGSLAGGVYRPTGFTTPEAPALQRLLAEAVERGTRWVAMEVSSHALAQKRVFATDFAAAVFTNLTRDHLDYHGDMDAYLAAKARLFTREGRGSERETVAVVNLEDPAGRRLAALADGRVVGYGLKGGVAYRARRVRSGPRGTRYELVSPRGTAPVALPLLGRFNVLNALAAQAATMELGASLEAAAAGVGRVSRVRGRMEPVGGDQPFLVLIDYAHTPDALERALRAVGALARGRVIVVFGCGGDRDRGKRPEMGRVASSGADRVVITSDNPRSEDPAAIAAGIMWGVEPGTDVATELDRAEAIRLALAAARPGDAVLVAGKGHETVQIVGTEERPFDDREVAARILTELGFHVDDAH